jgi:hypothetical protein
MSQLNEVVNYAGINIKIKYSSDRAFCQCFMDKMAENSTAKSAS